MKLDSGPVSVQYGFVYWYPFDQNFLISRNIFQIIKNKIKLSEQSVEEVKMMFWVNFISNIWKIAFLNMNVFHQKYGYCLFLIFIGV